MAVAVPLDQVKLAAPLALSEMGFPEQTKLGLSVAEMAKGVTFNVATLLAMQPSVLVAVTVYKVVVVGLFMVMEEAVEPVLQL